MMFQKGEHKYLQETEEITNKKLKDMNKSSKKKYKKTQRIEENE